MAHDLDVAELSASVEETIEAEIDMLLDSGAAAVADILPVASEETCEMREMADEGTCEMGEPTPPANNTHGDPEVDDDRIIQVDTAAARLPQNLEAMGGERRGRRGGSNRRAVRPPVPCTRRLPRQ